jgi:hypothetical protein
MLGALILSVWYWIGAGLLLTLAVLGIRFWRIMRAGMEFESSQLSAPFRIHLFPARDKSWTRWSAALVMTNALRRIGFTESGVFEIREIPQTMIHGFVHESAGIAAAVYMRGEQVWVDLDSIYEDGSSISYSIANVGAELPRPTSQIQIRFPGMELAALHHRLVTDRPRGILRHISADQFATLFEGSYAKLQDWLAERGGYTTSELRSLIPSSARLTVEQLQTIREKVAREALVNWWRLQAESPDQTDELNDCVAVIHDEMSLDQVLFTYSRMTGDWGADEKHIPPRAKSPPRAAFEALNEVRQGGLIKFLEKTTPLCADYYRNQATPTIEQGHGNR